MKKKKQILTTVILFESVAIFQIYMPKRVNNG